MKNNINYFLEKDPKSKELVYVEYENLEGYKITPKTKKEDAIEVNKIVFVSPNMSEKIIKKKIDIKIRKLLDDLKIIDEEDSGDDSSIKESLMDAEKLRINIIKKYTKYLGNSYKTLSLKKLQIIINELRIRLYSLREKEESQNIYIPKFIDELVNEEKKGRGSR